MSTAGPLAVNRPERVAVVIPAFDEAQRIEATIRAAQEIPGADLVVVVDDGSSDATAAIAMGADALVVRHRRNQGKAAAMATGAQLVAMREEAARADGGETFREELHAEPRQPGHTGPLPVIGADGEQPRALLFLDADMGASASAAQPLVDAVLGEGVDMAIALLPPQDGAGGMGVVVRTARSSIRRATGWEPTQPLSGTRCITREAWDACQPLAPGWGVETALTIDALDGGFWVKEVPCELHHRVTGNDLRGRMHRAAQLRDVLRALARRRHVTPGTVDDAAEADLEAAEADLEAALGAEGAVGAVGAMPLSEPGVEPTEEPQAEGASQAETTEEPRPESEPQAESAPRAESELAPPAPRASAAEDGEAQALLPDAEAAVEIAGQRRSRLAGLEVDGVFTDDQLRALGDVDAEALARRLRDLPLEGRFAPDDVVLLAGTDLGALGEWMREIPVTAPFRPEHAVLLAAHMGHAEPTIPEAAGALSPDEYVSLVIHAAVEDENRGEA